MTPTDPAAYEWFGRPVRSETIEARLLANRTITDSGCWEWTRYRRNGYGRIWVDGRLMTVHRLAAHLWIEGFSYDGPDMACHRCDNPPCFNPDHLFAGTAFDNMSDAGSKGRLSTPRGPRETVYPRRKPCAACGQDYEPDGDHRGRSIVCSAACLASWRSAHALAKNAEETDEMRALIAAGMTYRAVGERFGVTASAVHRRVNGRRAAA